MRLAAFAARLLLQYHLEMYPRVLAFAKAILERVPANARILEIGAGEGQLTQLLRDAGCNVTPLDPKPRAAFDVITLRFEDFEAEPQSYDCIATQLVLHHAEDLDALLNKAQKLLKADGILAIDDYGWERASDDVSDEWRNERRDLYTSEVMLEALRACFMQTYYADHAYFGDGAGDDSLAFTFIGKRKREPA
jgi:SAM-dependent methyltransferase